MIFNVSMRAPHNWHVHLSELLSGTSHPRPRFVNAEDTVSAVSCSIVQFCAHRSVHLYHGTCSMLASHNLILNHKSLDVPVEHSHLSSVEVMCPFQKLVHSSVLSSRILDEDDCSQQARDEKWWYCLRVNHQECFQSMCGLIVKTPSELDFCAGYFGNRVLVYGPLSHLQNGLLEFVNRYLLDSNYERCFHGRVRRWLVMEEYLPLI